MLCFVTPWCNNAISQQSLITSLLRGSTVGYPSDSLASCYPRDALHCAVYDIVQYLSASLSVCLSFTRRYCVETVEHVILRLLQHGTLTDSRFQRCIKKNLADIGCVCLLTNNLLNNSHCSIQIYIRLLLRPKLLIDRMSSRSVAGCSE